MALESFHWDNHFETGLEAVDQEHRVLVDLINRFGQMLTQAERPAPGQIEAVLQALTNYSLYHFENEEGMMALQGLDPRHITMHQRFHRDFLAEVARLQHSVQREQEAAPGLLKFLTHWLAFHILGTDQSMARQIAAIHAGQSAAEAFEVECQMKEGPTEPLLLALNGLFQQVSERNRQLQELTLTLEAKIEERTRDLSQANHLLEQIALTDVLTELPNRRHVMAWFENAWKQSVDCDRPLSCLMIDADGFKHINDQYGHEAGDEVLRHLARQLRASVRNDDFVARLGGDEFLIVCMDTSREGALLAAEKLRQEVASLKVAVEGGGQWLGCVSVGVAQRDATIATVEDLLKRADEGLYQAKRQGRNCVAAVESTNDSETFGLLASAH